MSASQPVAQPRRLLAYRDPTSRRGWWRCSLWRSICWRWRRTSIRARRCYSFPTVTRSTLSTANWGGSLLPLAGLLQQAHSTRRWGGLTTLLMGLLTVVANAHPYHAVILAGYVALASLGAGGLSVCGPSGWPAAAVGSAGGGPCRRAWIAFVGGILRLRAECRRDRRSAIRPRPLPLRAPLAR